MKPNPLATPTRDLARAVAERGDQRRPVPDLDLDLDLGLDERSDQLALAPALVEHCEQCRHRQPATHLTVVAPSAAVRA
jgi:hypothetical protein